MPTDLIESQLVVWKPNTDQVVSLPSGSFVITVLDADYPAIGTTKNLSASVSGYSDTFCQAGVRKSVGGTALGVSSGSVAKLATGKELVDASVSGLSSAIRCSVFGAANLFTSPPTASAGYSGFQVNSTVAVTNAIETTTPGTYSIVLHSNTASTLNLWDMSSSGPVFSQLLFQEGQTVGATTIAAGELESPRLSNTYFQFWHLRRNPTNNLRHFVWGTKTSKYYYWREGTGTFYLNSHTTFAPYSSGAYESIAVYPETDTTTHIFCLTTFTQSGRTYYTPQLLTYNGTSWLPAVRFGGSTWAAGYTIREFRVIRADANDPQKLYLLMSTVGSYWIVWVDLATRTASSTITYASTTGRICANTVGWGDRSQSVDDSVVQSGQTGNLVIRAGSVSTDTTWLFEDEFLLTYTVAGWKTPTVSLAQISTAKATSNPASWHYVHGHLVINNQLYHATYAVHSQFSNQRYLWSSYRSVTSNTSGTYQSWGPVSGLGFFPFSNTGDRYYIRATENQAVNSSGHLIVFSDASGTATYFVRPSWTTSSFAMHLAPVGQGLATASLNLNVLTAAQDVQLDGSLSATSSASLIDLYIGPKVYLDGLLAEASSTSTMALQTTNANVDGATYSVSSVSLTMRVGKTLLDSQAVCNPRALFQLSVFHTADIVGAALGQSSGYFSPLVERRPAAALLSNAIGALGLTSARLLAGNTGADASGASQLLLDRRLAALLSSTSSASLRMSKSVDLIDGVSVLTKNSQVSVKTPKP